MRESEIYYLFTNTRKRSSKKTILSSSHPRTRVKHQKRRSVVILDERSSFPRFTGGRLRSVTRFFLRVSLVRRPVEPVSIGRVESRRFFFLSLSLALPLLPPTSGINPGARSAKVNALIKKLPQPTVIPNHSRSRSASRFKSARFSTRYFKSYSFSFLPILVFSMASKRGAIFFLNLIWSLKFFSKMGKEDLRKLNPSLGKFFSTVGKGGI